MGIVAGILGAPEEFARHGLQPAAHFALGWRQFVEPGAQFAEVVGNDAAFGGATWTR